MNIINYLIIFNKTSYISIFIYCSLFCKDVLVMNLFNFSIENETPHLTLKLNGISYCLLFSSSNHSKPLYNLKYSSDDSNLKIVQIICLFRLH